MEVHGLVVAAGLGIRTGLGRPKQFARLGGTTVLARTLNAFLKHPKVSGCCVVIAAGQEQIYRDSVLPDLVAPAATAVGGPTRTQSVRNGLEALTAANPTHVLIHDGARPFLSSGLLDEMVRQLRRWEAAVPVLPVSDALWQQEFGRLNSPIGKADKCRAQTPQGFAFKPILEAYRNFTGQADDDAAVALAMGLRPRAFAGSPTNMKITYADDIALGEKMVLDPTPTRIGFGHDVHRLVPGDGVTLCGIKIPWTMSLSGHSDADVATHAISDAIYGGLADGDIGRWFPPDDPRWKDADSMVFLRHAADRAAELAHRITGVDCTIVCEQPRIAPHATEMRQRIADCLGIAVEFVSVKATTTEGLGFAGKGEGIIAHAVVALSRC